MCPMFPERSKGSGKGWDQVETVPAGRGGQGPPCPMAQGGRVSRVLGAVLRAEERGCLRDREVLPISPAAVRKSLGGRERSDFCGST